MGFSVSGGTVVLFLGIVISFGMAYTAASNGLELVNDAYEDSTDDELVRENTDVSIGQASNTGSTTLNVTVENTGSTTLSVNDTDLLIDGNYTSLTDENMITLDVDGNSETDLWVPGETLHIEYDYGSDPAPSRVKIVTEPGVSASAGVS
ncbi:fla cluster protein FlaF [Halorussus marinus]|uniref:fla cluster protein FlaF n=1 Tax=Halorussus marinus TaxID=2505976 RepID=UPI00106ED26F|nr:fla cluster protein FlaF [Halorussus marinus]